MRDTQRTPSRPRRADVLGSRSARGLRCPSWCCSSSASRCRCSAAAIWGVIATARLHLLGAGLGAQPGGRVRRSDRDRLGGAADARRLHHQRARGRHRPAGALALSGARNRRRGRRGLRRHRRPAGAAAAHVLFRHDDARLCHDRHADRAGVEERHRRRRRRSRAGLPRRRSTPRGGSTISASASRRSAPG